VPRGLRAGMKKGLPGGRENPGEAGVKETSPFGLLKEKRRAFTGERLPVAALCPAPG